MPPAPKPRKRSLKARMKKALLRQRRSLQRRARPKVKGRPRFKNGRDPAKLEWIRQLRCDLWKLDAANCGGITEAAHTTSRGAGGTDEQTVPLCSAHHRSQHLMGIKTFELFCYGPAITLADRAAGYQRQYEKSVEAGWAPEKP